MTNDPTITHIIDANAKNSCGEAGTRQREVTLSYSKGRGIYLHVTTLTVAKSEHFTSRSFDMFGAGNMRELVEPMTRIKPSVLKALGARLEENADGIHALMTDWDDNAVWETTEMRKAALSLIIPIIRGTLQAEYEAAEASEAAA